MSAEQKENTKNAIAKHYGYANWKEAMQACFKSRTQGCGGDFVRHLRDKSAEAELQKYGFKTWADAASQCTKEIQTGDVNHCETDPFLKRRLKARS
jgi:hypothetical protein